MDLKKQKIMAFFVISISSFLQAMDYNNSPYLVTEKYIAGLYSQGIEQHDMDKLREIEILAGKGNSVAQRYMGFICTNGIDSIKPDKDLAYNYFKDSAEQGDLDALSSLYCLGIDFKNKGNNEKAVSCLGIAVNKGFLPAFIPLADLFAEKKSFAFAKSLYSFVAQFGYEEATERLNKLKKFE